MDERRSQVLPEYIKPSSDDSDTETLPLHGKEQTQAKPKDQEKTTSGGPDATTQNGKRDKAQSPFSSLLHSSKVSIRQSAQGFKQHTKHAKHARAINITAIVAGVALLAFAFYTIWYSFLATQPVTVFRVGKQQIVTQNVGGGGLVDAKQNFNLQFPLAERVMGVMVKPGDHIKHNQPLLRLDPSQLNAQVQQAANDVAAAQAYLNSVAASAPNPIAVAAAQQAFQIANNHYHALVAQTNSPTLHNGNLISPVDGTVITVTINPGEVFAANTILMTLSDQSSLIIHTQIPLANLQQVHLNSPAQITPSALPSVTLNGTVTSIIPQANAQTDTFQVDVTVTNGQQLLLPGMSAYVRLQGQQNAFVVPRISVLNPDHESSVYVIQNNHAYLKQVHVAGSAPDVFYVDSGLSTNDQIVVLPLNRLHQGQTVTVNAVEQ
ncbi:efflux RND transporter periplasmic adaptor subunit [Dictyobacter kobayashii]|uniref:RND efflux pump membrane fusion protein barrel-sandwich domain-containing protein n=1 Tax=Dictyobacter kobayashii TaxID=2014872 RepID=A0A402ABY6_9CHLR|nr:efflux RND transporter periplasmic adaptor subunit [Dictyobacter kobayashii]GCE16601.1 hypothetical protein KDK_04010 [Dictyobacter kobayashii]